MFCLSDNVIIPLIRVVVNTFFKIFLNFFLNATLVTLRNRFFDASLDKKTTPAMVLMYHSRGCFLFKALLCNIVGILCLLSSELCITKYFVYLHKKKLYFFGIMLDK